MNGYEIAAIIVGAAIAFMLIAATIKALFLSKKISDDFDKSGNRP